MGKLLHNTQIKHSSHPHLLQLLSNLHLENQAPINCNGCNLQISPSDHIYTCRPCNFFLHTSCSKFPELITHPAHREHALALLPTSIYPGGFFSCDACSMQGTKFSYHCQVCDFDLHVLCASKPLSVNHPFHVHPLVLTFSSPYGEKIGFSCDVCSSVGSGDQWLYRCVACEFDVHLHCATAKMPIPSSPSTSHSIQHSNSFPRVAPNQFMNPVAGQPLYHSMSTGHVQTYLQPQNPIGVQGYQQPQPQPIGAQGFQRPQPQPVGAQGYQQPQPQTFVAQGYQQPQPQPVGVQGYQQPQPQPVGVQGYQQPQPQPVGVQGYQQPQPPMANQNVAPDNGIGNAMATGFVDGMMQQLGQNFVQSLTGGGNGGGNGNGGGGDVVNIDYQCTTVNENYENYENSEIYETYV